MLVEVCQVPGWLVPPFQRYHFCLMPLASGVGQGEWLDLFPPRGLGVDGNRRGNMCACRLRVARVCVCVVHLAHVSGCLADTPRCRRGTCCLPPRVSDARGSTSSDFAFLSCYQRTRAFPHVQTGRMLGPILFPTLPHDNNIVIFPSWCLGSDEAIASRRRA